MTRSMLAVSLMLLLFMPGLQAQEEAEGMPAIGFSVSPGGMMIQGVTPGQLYDLAQRSGVELKVTNSDTKPRTYRFIASKPSAAGNGKWLSGYLEIPDPNWFWFEKQQLTIQPHGEGSVKMYLKVPEGEQYYNQHWAVSVGVQGASESGEMVALAVYPRYQIETEPKPQVTAAPEGLLGTTPSLLRFEALQPGGEGKEARITLHNNAVKPMSYSLSIKTFRMDPTREQITPLPGNAWILDPSLVSVQEARVSIDGGQSRSVSVRVSIPEAAEYFGKYWEALLWIEPEGGLPQFARIQMETASAP